jgi:DNA-binding NarL/FixJ family response regulator
VEVVGEAASGFEAIQKAAELKPDLVLLDIHLPDINGIDVSSRIDHAIPGMKILFATQNNDPDLVRVALNNGALGLLLKVDAPTELLPAIETALRGENFVSKQAWAKLSQ